VIAAAPVVAVLLAFSLLITLIRNSRTRSLSAAPSRRDARLAAKQQAAIASVLKTRPPAPPIALPAATAPLPAPAAPTAPVAPVAPVVLQTAPSLIAPPPAEPSPTVPSSVLDESASPVTAPPPAPEPASVPEEPEVLTSGSPLAAPVVPTTAAPVVPTFAATRSASSPQVTPTTRATSVTPASGFPRLAPPNTDVTPPTDVAAGPADAEADSADPETDQAQEQTAEGDSREQTAEGDSREQTSEDDYWDANIDARLAGQVYPVEPTDTKADLPADRSQTGNLNRDGDVSGFAQQPQAPELDDDAPPFATAPFATIPRLNRVRATPTPPADADEDKDS
jgi:hypothetical protein